MTTAEIDALICRVTAACLRERAPKRQDVCRASALVLPTDSDFGQREAFSQLQILREAGWDLRVVADACALARLSADARVALGAALEIGASVDGAGEDLEAMLEGRDLLLVPTLSVSAAAKAADLIRDDLTSQLLAGALERGVPIIAARNGCCADDPERAARGFYVANAYKARMRANLAVLKSYGIRLVAARKLAEAAEEIGFLEGGERGSGRKRPDSLPSRRVFAQSEALEHEEGELRLDRDVLVTPLAADELRRRGIRIIRI